MYTIMQLSDLHRSEADPISNSELLSSLTADSDRFSKEEPRISMPNAIVVTGDLVQGLPLGSPDYPEGLKKQYDEALELLKKLADHFVGGDRSKVIIVPGNHDVDWNMARSAMKIVNPSDQNIQKLLSIPNSSYRWSWESRELFQVTDHSTYENRFKYFWDLYNRFYQNSNLDFPVDAQRYWNLFKLDDGNITVCTFNSCANNDCYSLSGEIPAEFISNAHLKLIKDRSSLLLAVWHHDVQGPPMRSDYMNQDTVRLMIDKGFRLGLHGHMHRSDALPHFLYTSHDKHIMALIGCGSLCAASTDLPTGIGRQYNVVEIADDYRWARVHVREMNVPLVFSAGRLVALGGLSYADVEWTSAPADTLVNTGRSGGPTLALVENIERLIDEGSYHDAVELASASQGKLSHHGRLLLTKAMCEGQMWDALATHLSKPQNFGEVTTLIKALVELKNWAKAERVLKFMLDPGQFPEANVRDLVAWFEAERRIKQ